MSNSAPLRGCEGDLVEIVVKVPYGVGLFWDAGISVFSGISSV